MSNEKGISKTRKVKSNNSFVLLFFVMSFGFAFTQNRQNNHLKKQEKIADSLFLLCKNNIKKGAYKKALFSVNKGLKIYEDLPS